jgi:hypothetical protein
MQTITEKSQVVILVGGGRKRRLAKQLLDRLHVSYGQQVSFCSAVTEYEERLLPFERFDRTRHGATSVEHLPAKPCGKSCAAFIQEMSVEEFSSSELDSSDTHYPLMLGIRARRAM